MPIQKSEKRTAETKKAAKPQKRKYYVRLKRGGQHGEEGLARYYFKGKMYRREGIYRVDQKVRVALKRTGKFEDILPDDLTEAKEQAKAGRGITLNQRTRLKRRDAQRQRRRRFAPVAEDDGDLGEYELADEDVDPDLADDPDGDDPDGDDTDGIDAGDEGEEQYGV